MQEADAVCNGEEWRPVVGYEGFYEVSDRGRVKRIAPGPGTQIGRILTPHNTSKGYPFVALSRESIAKSLLLHNIVTAAFLGPKPPGMQVNHIDGNKWNPRLSNLEYVTGSDNQRHAFCLGLMKKSLTPSLVREIRLWEGKLSAPATAAIFGISATTVQYIWRRVYWATVSDYDPVDFWNF